MKMKNKYNFKILITIKAKNKKQTRIQQNNYISNKTEHIKIQDLLKNYLSK